MQKAEFEKILRYYIWGGKEAYGIRQKMRELGPGGDADGAVELPKWSTLVKFSGLVIAGPQFLFGSALAARELSMKIVAGEKAAPEAHLQSLLKSNNRAKQYISGISEYLVQAANLPIDLGKRVDRLLFGP